MAEDLREHRRDQRPPAELAMDGEVDHRAGLVAVEIVERVARDYGEVVASWGRGGRMAGQFKWVHGIAIDSKGNLYTAEVGHARRAQKFTRTN